MAPERSIAPPELKRSLSTTLQWREAGAVGMWRISRLIPAGGVLSCAGFVAVRALVGP